MVAPVLDLLCSQGILIVGYLDNLLLRETVSTISVSQGLTYDADSLEIWMDPNLQKLIFVQICHLEYLSLVLDVTQSRDFISYGEASVSPGRL